MPAAGYAYALFVDKREKTIVRAWIERFTASYKIQLSPQQQSAVEMAVYSRIMNLAALMPWRSRCCKNHRRLLF
ncbi:hypothetical protein LC607_08615 [Nostoc sp. CHAB 5824]|nr:hypothetical protein [Nostoc sp. CHAB 5824]